MTTVIALPQRIDAVIGDDTLARELFDYAVGQYRIYSDRILPNHQPTKWFDMEVERCVARRNVDHMATLLERALPGTHWVHEIEQAAGGAIECHFGQPDASQMAS